MNFVQSIVLFRDDLGEIDKLTRNPAHSIQLSSHRAGQWDLKSL